MNYTMHIGGFKKDCLAFVSYCVFLNVHFVFSDCLGEQPTEARHKRTQAAVP